MGLASDELLAQLVGVVLLVGFVGAYTTFSTFEYETQRLTESGALWWGAILPEERYLSSTFGAECDAYRARVRRWL